ncbi:MAG: M42 family metallopeptidase [Actinobacteria bacterium]|nr:M42 family metallopeptidase [Actinomycetota bacterium]
MTALKELIKKLVETFGPSGSEEQIRAVIESEIKGFVDDVRVDALGNLIAVKKAAGTVAGSPGAGRARPKKVMLSAHMDEIGLIITHVDEKGFLRFSNIGGVSPHVLLGERVIFGNGAIGVFGAEKLDDIKDLKYDKMFIDIGCRSREEAQAKVRMGDACAYYRKMDDLGDRITAKSLDDRIGCAILIQVLKELKETPNEIYFVWSVQEEVGARGAKAAAFGIDPDVGIALDVTAVGDTPEARRMEVALGKGAAIKVKYVSLIAHPRVKDLLIGAAENNSIPYQLEILEFGGTDAGAIHLVREGVPSGVVSIPTRYLHTPSELCDLGDVRACVDLMVKLLEKPVEV